ncbi:MAG: CHASE2 domain-containing protein [Pseudomonadota bacterium]
MPLPTRQNAQNSRTSRVHRDGPCGRWLRSKLCCFYPKGFLGEFREAFLIGVLFALPLFILSLFWPPFAKIESIGLDLQRDVALLYGPEDLRYDPAHPGADLVFLDASEAACDRFNQGICPRPYFYPPAFLQAIVEAVAEAEPAALVLDLKLPDGIAPLEIAVELTDETKALLKAMGVEFPILIAAQQHNRDGVERVLLTPWPEEDRPASLLRGNVHLLGDSDVGDAIMRRAPAVHLAQVAPDSLETSLLPSLPLLAAIILDGERASRDSSLPRAAEAPMVARIAIAALFPEAGIDPEAVLEGHTATTSCAGLEQLLGCRLWQGLQGDPIGLQARRLNGTPEPEAEELLAELKGQEISFTYPALAPHPHRYAGEDSEALHEIRDEMRLLYANHYAYYDLADFAQPGQIGPFHGLLEGAVVFVGTSALAGGDWHKTPVGLMTGAEVLINATETFASSYSLRPPLEPSALETFWDKLPATLADFALNLFFVFVGALVFVYLYMQLQVLRQRFFPFVSRVSGHSSTQAGAEEACLGRLWPSICAFILAVPRGVLRLLVWGLIYGLAISAALFALFVLGVWLTGYGIRIDILLPLVAIALETLFEDFKRVVSPHKLQPHSA